MQSNTNFRQARLPCLAYLITRMSENESKFLASGLLAIIRGQDFNTRLEVEVTIEHLLYRRQRKKPTNEDTGRQEQQWNEGFHKIA